MLSERMISGLIGKYKRDDFAFWIISFPHMDSNIPTKPRVDFVDRLRRHSLLPNQQGFKCTLLPDPLINSSSALGLSQTSIKLHRGIGNQWLYGASVSFFKFNPFIILVPTNYLNMHLLSILI